MTDRTKSPEPPPYDALARSCWDESADAWNHFVESGLDYYRIEFHGPALLDACSPVSGQDVLDLGCGQGWFSRQLARQGARVVGIDWSTRLIAHARQHEASQPLGITYETLDAAEVARRFVAESFDLITACMSIMDMPRPDLVLASARALLRDHGRLVMSVCHPLTETTHREWKYDEHGNKLALEIDRYFDTTPQIVEWNMKRLAHHFRTVQYRYTLEQWSRLIEDAGLAIARLREPRPAAELVARQPEFDDARRVPYVLIFDLQARRAR